MDTFHKNHSPLLSLPPELFDRVLGYLSIIDLAILTFTNKSVQNYTKQPFLTRLESKRNYHSFSKLVATCSKQDLSVPSNAHLARAYKMVLHSTSSQEILQNETREMMKMKWGLVNTELDEEWLESILDEEMMDEHLFLGDNPHHNVLEVLSNLSEEWKEIYFCEWEKEDAFTYQAIENQDPVGLTIMARDGWVNFPKSVHRAALLGHAPTLKAVLQIGAKFPKGLQRVFLMAEYFRWDLFEFEEAPWTNGLNFQGGSQNIFYWLSKKPPNSKKYSKILRMLLQALKQGEETTFGANKLQCAFLEALDFAVELGTPVDLRILELRILKVWLEECRNILVPETVADIEWKTALERRDAQSIKELLCSDDLTTEM